MQIDLNEPLSVNMAELEPAEGTPPAGRDFGATQVLDAEQGAGLEYVIRYQDGAYNQGHGFSCRKFEATRYPSLAVALKAAEMLCDVAGVEPVGECAGPQSELVGNAAGQPQYDLDEAEPGEAVEASASASWQAESGYVIRYQDGAYSQGNGFSCRKFEATRYPSQEAALKAAEMLCDVAGVESLGSTAGDEGGYVLRYADGAYNRGAGFPCRKHEATSYPTYELAKAAAAFFSNVVAVEPAELIERALPVKVPHSGQSAA